MSKKLIAAFFGNSLTLGNLGIGFSTCLHPAEDTELLFRGVNGDTMLGVTSRVLSFLKRRINTENLLSLVIECGANDLLLPYVSEVDTAWALAVKALLQKGKEPISNPKELIPLFSRRLESVAEAVDSFNLPISSVAVMTIPILGEDLFSRLNIRKREVNTAIKNICKETGIICIDSEYVLEQIIINRSSELDNGYYFFPTSESPDLFITDADFIAGNPENADSLSQKRGLIVTVDGLHFNSTGALAVAKIVDEFLSAVLLKNQLLL